MTAFRATVLIIFGVFIAIGVFSFLSFRGGGDSVIAEDIEVWGVVPSRLVNGVISDLSREGSDDFPIKYKEKDLDTFDAELLDALASGYGPDLFILPDDMMVKYTNKAFLIPYDSMPERTFRDTFIEIGELYMTDSGIVGIPFVVDPMVMYWNRDVLSSAGIPNPPKFWDEILLLALDLTIKDDVSNINQSTVAFGEYRNITNAKEVISMLILQTGNSITERIGENVKFVLNDKRGFSNNPVESALRFYTEFADPVKPTYSWNRSLPSSMDMFTQGDLAFYFGLASEASSIKTKNPHLNFDVGVIPQIRGNKTRATFGKVHWLVLSKNSSKLNSAFQAVSIMSGQDFLKRLMAISGLPPVRRDLLTEKPENIFSSIFFESALLSKGWLDVDGMKTDEIFQTMIEDIISGKVTISKSIGQANLRLQNLLK